VSHWPVLFGEGGGFSTKVFLVCIWVFFFGVEDVEDGKKCPVHDFIEGSNSVRFPLAYSHLKNLMILYVVPGRSREFGTSSSLDAHRKKDTIL
jgi:hypothetical protein